MFRSVESGCTLWNVVNIVIPDSSEEMKTFLTMQQKAMAFVIETVNNDMKSLKIITEGMNQMV